jgi:hypothetical protein
MNENHLRGQQPPRETLELGSLSLDVHIKNGIRQMRALANAAKFLQEHLR